MAAETPTNSFAKLKIMIVEDDRLLSDLLAKKLAPTGCSLVHAGDGAEALTRMRADRPDLIVLDILMPGMNGFELLQHIHEDAALKTIPVLLLSNLGQEQDVARGKSLGAVNFLIKATVTLDEIINEIKRVALPDKPKH